MPNYSLGYSFLTVPPTGDDSDLVIKCIVRHLYDATGKPASPEPPQITVRRWSGSKNKVSPGHVAISEPTTTTLRVPDTAASATGEVTGLLTGAARRQLTGDVWEFLVRSKAGAVDVGLIIHAHPNGSASPAAGSKVNRTQTPALGQARVLFNPATPRPSAHVVSLKPEPFPRLVVGLNSGMPNKIPACDPASATVADIKILLEAIHGRLQAGLADAWAGAQGTIPTVGAFESTVEPLRVANEVWANQVSEMLTLVPYGGPGASYAYSESKLVAAGLSDTQGNPYYPITAACQQLCSFALASRGMDFQPYAGGRGLRLLHAGGTVRRTWVDAMHGKWVTADNATTPTVVDGSTPAPSPLDSYVTPNAALRRAPMLFKVHEVDPSVAFGPGAVFLYSNRLLRGAADDFVQPHADGKICEYTLHANARQEVWRVSSNGRNLADNTAGAHIGFVLRADWATKTFQIFDTGGCQVADWGTGVMALADTGAGFHSGIFDGPTCTEVGAGSDPYRGVGVLPFASTAADQKSEADKILKHVNDVLKKARPLGLVRFVLMRRGPAVHMKDVWRFRQQDWLIYASPMMLTWESGDLDNYPIARYLWSLRDLPRSDEIQAMWLVYVPRKELAAAMIEQGRGVGLPALLRLALSKLPTVTKDRYIRQEAAGKRIEPNLLVRFSFPIANLTHREDGSVYVSATFRKFNKMHVIHALEGRWGEARLPLDQSYLQGAQSDSSFPGYFRTF